MVGENNKAVIQAAVCMGCGSCAAECPARAITLRNYSEAQVCAAVKGLLGQRVAVWATGAEGADGGTAGEEGGEGEEKNFLEQVGIAQTRWPDE